MKKAKLSELHLLEAWLENEPGPSRKIAYPFYQTTGTEKSAVVYFELDPGKSLGTHTDSAEEIILILQGNAEVTLDEEMTHLGQNEMVLIPTMAPHNLRNIGSETLKVIGFFPSNNIESTFEKPLMPLNQTVVSAPAIPTDQPLTWNEVVSKIIPSDPV